MKGGTSAGSGTINERVGGRPYYLGLVGPQQLYLPEIEGRRPTPTPYRNSWESPSAALYGSWAPQLRTIDSLPTIYRAYSIYVIRLMTDQEIDHITYMIHRDLTQ
jgi:hypothetical protein